MPGCKAGDLAQIIHPDAYGKLVNVLYEPPKNIRYMLPDGQIAISTGEGLYWVIEILGSPLEVTLTSPTAITKRKAIYGSCADKWLIPYRPSNTEDETPVGRELDVHMAELSSEVA